MNIIQMLPVILIITNRMFPIAPLPQSAFMFSLP